MKMKLWFQQAFDCVAGLKHIMQNRLIIEKAENACWENESKQSTIRLVNTVKDPAVEWKDTSQLHVTAVQKHEYSTRNVSTLRSWNQLFTKKNNFAQDIDLSGEQIKK